MSSDTEIDIAALDPEGGNLILGECKYWKEPVGANVLRELEAKAVSVPWRKGSRKLWYVLFSVSGFTEELQEQAKNRGDILLAGGSVLKNARNSNVYLQKPII